MLAVAIAAQRRGDARQALTATAAWFLAWALLFGPSTENATFSILAPALAWAVVRAFGRPRAWGERAWLLACVYLVGMATSDAGGPFRLFFGSWHATTVGTLLFQAWLVADWFRTRAAAPAGVVTPAGVTPVTSRRAA